MSIKRITRRSLFKAAGATAGVAVLASCSPKPAPVPEAPKPVAQEATKPAAAAPAPVKLIQLVYFYGGAAQRDQQLVEDAMSDYMKDRINATISLNPIEFAAFTEKMRLMDAAGEAYDLCYTSSWANPYYDAVRNGVYEDLTDLIPQFAPRYYASMNPAVWLGPRIKGRFYAGVNQQIFPAAVGPCACPKALVDKYGLDLDKVVKPEDMEPWMEKIVAGEKGNVIPYHSGYNPWWTALWGLDGAGYGVTEYNDTDLKVWDVWDHPQWQRCMGMIKNWYSKGFMIKEIMPTGERDAAAAAGKFGFLFHRAKPGGAAERKARWGWEVVEKIIENPTVLSTGNIISTMTGIPKRAQDVETSVRYLELINTDKVLYNILCKGVEGTHWVWKDKDKQVITFAEGLDAQTSGYNPNTDWQFGDQFNAYYVSEDQVGAWEETRKVNDGSVPSVLLGFALDREPIKNELAAVDAAGKEFADMYFGIMDYTKVQSDFVARLKAAGSDTVKEELQRQLNEWKATQ
jgi:putative aldouronate transport system substrate-binding protein